MGDVWAQFSYLNEWYFWSIIVCHQRLDVRIKISYSALTHIFMYNDLKLISSPKITLPNICYTK